MRKRRKLLISKGQFKKPELLLPAKGPEELISAINFGADAVYIGGDTMGLRAQARNFSMEEMSASIGFAHEKKVKVFVTANIFAHNEDIGKAEEYFKELSVLKPDALIISDPGVFSLAKELCPEIDIHISTQANNTNYRTALFWHKLGASRIVVARELSLSEIADIRRKIPPGMEIEAFVHGAMCISYSGRCLLSNYFTSRDANRGNCAHPCRWRYSVMEESRPGVYLPVEENDRGTFLFNSKDLSMVGHIPDLIEAGIDSFKIEGRMKNALYVATAARVYRRAIDDYFDSVDTYNDNLDWYLSEIGKCTARPFSTGFFYGKPDYSSQIYDGKTYTQDYIYLGMVERVTEDSLAVIRQKNKFSVGDEIEVVRPHYDDFTVTVLGIQDSEGETRESAPHPKEELYLRLSQPVAQYDILRKNP